MDFLFAPVAGAAVFIVAVLVFIITIKSLIVIVPPNRAAVITGRNRQLTDGQAVGYRSISGGRTLRIPIIETVQHVNSRPSRSRSPSTTPSPRGTSRSAWRRSRT